ncbi:MAG: sugar phosphate nucleotidyltransferase [Acidobacteriota bacterium]
MLLAAGFGRRLVPLTLERAKPALPFLNRPLLLRQLDYLDHRGVDSVVVNLHHRPESILTLLRQEGKHRGGGAFSKLGGPRQEHPSGGPSGDRFHLSGMEILISAETERLGTSGGLRKVAEEFKDRGTLVCLNADMLTEIDLHAARAAHVRSGLPATLVLAPFREGCPFTPVHHDGERVLSFGGEQDSPARGIFTGIHFLEPELLERLPEGPSEFLPDLYWPLIREGDAPGVLVANERWMEVGSAGRFLESQIRALSEAPFTGHRLWPQAGVNLPDIRQACAVDIHPPVLWGPECFLGWGAILAPGTILGRGVQVGEGVRLENCVIGDGVRIGPGTSLTRVVVGPETQVPAGVEVSSALLQGGLEGLDEPAARPALSWQGIWRAAF